jgi:hypothetical protein
LVVISCAIVRSFVDGNADCTDSTTLEPDLTASNTLSIFLEEFKTSVARSDLFIKRPIFDTPLSGNRIHMIVSTNSGVVCCAALNSFSVVYDFDGSILKNIFFSSPTSALLNSSENNCPHAK